MELDRWNSKCFPMLKFCKTKYMFELVTSSWSCLEGVHPTEIEVAMIWYPQAHFLKTFSNLMCSLVK